MDVINSEIEKFDLINVDESSKDRIIGLNGFLSPKGVLIAIKNPTIYTHKILRKKLSSYPDFDEYIIIRNGKNPDERSRRYINTENDGLICFESVGEIGNISIEQAKAIGNYLKINKYKYYDELENLNIKNSIGYVILKNSEGFGINSYERDYQKAVKTLKVYNEALGLEKLSFIKTIMYMQGNETNYLFNKSNEK